MKSVDDAVKVYISACIGEAEATEKADSTLGNKCYDLKIEALKAIRSAGDAGVRALLLLLTHEHISVRYSAAAHLINTHPEQAVKVLEAVAQSDGIIAFTAKMVLQEWRKGTLKIP